MTDKLEQLARKVLEGDYEEQFSALMEIIETTPLIAEGKIGEELADVLIDADSAKALLMDAQRKPTCGIWISLYTAIRMLDEVLTLNDPAEGIDHGCAGLNGVYSPPEEMEETDDDYIPF